MAASGASSDLLQHACDVTRTAHGVHDLDAAAFAEAATSHAQARLERLGLEATPERTADALARMCLEDLCLAHACDAGSETAWSAFHGAYTPRLTGLARKQGLDAERAETEVTGLLADLALPPPRAKAATVLGTYRGTGSLFGWLAVILMRRIARARRRPQPQSLDAGAGVAPDPALQHAEEPADVLLDDELAAALRTALREGWDACTPRERVVLALKHRDGRAHREIAETLGVGVPRVSQLLKESLARLTAAVRRHVPNGLGVRARAIAQRETENALATFEPTPPPTPRDGDAGDTA